MERKTALTYDDIQLIPSYSEIKSRNDIDLSTKLTTNYDLKIPLIASPMDTVCEIDMAFKLFLLGGTGCIHRFMSIEEQSRQIELLKYKIFGEGFGGPYETWDYPERIPLVAAIGVQEEDKIRAKSLEKAGANVLIIDVAHGHHQNVVKMVKWCKDNLPDIDIIGGNIATPEAAEMLEAAGVDGLRVGIGNGSLCTTRIQTGFGVPTVTSLENIIKIAKTPVMADGGIRTSGDISKALALGSSSVMLGSLIAGTKESPGKVIERFGAREKYLFKRYRGSASLETKMTHNKEERNIEGESTMIPFKGGVKFIIYGLLDGIKSALSYGGARNLSEFKPEYYIITNAGIEEAKPHLLK